jgi:hypothetical protein
MVGCGWNLPPATFLITRRRSEFWVRWVSLRARFVLRGWWLRIQPIFLSWALDDMLEEGPQMGNHMLANLIKLLYSRLYDVNQDIDLRSTANRLRDRVQGLSPGDPLLDELFAEE